MDFGGVQQHPSKPLRPHPSIVVGIPVFAVSNDRETEMLAVNSDLVGAARNRPRFDQGRVTVVSDNLEQCLGFLTISVHLRHSFTAAKLVLQKRCGELLPAPWETTHEQRDIDLVHAVGAQVFMQPAQCTSLFGDQQAPRCIPVEPMHQLEVICSGPQMSQCFDHSVIHPAATVHSHSGRLVDD